MQQNKYIVSQFVKYLVSQFVKGTEGDVEVLWMPIQIQIQPP